MMGLFDRIRRWRYGGVSGRNELRSQLRMAVQLIAPYVVGKVLVNQFIPPEQWEAWEWILLASWLFYCVGSWFMAKADALKIIPFPSAGVRYPDGSSTRLDFKVVPDGWKKVIEFKDGRVGYRVRFMDRYMYQDPKLPYPIVYDQGFWLLPSEWDKAFVFNAQGEFYHKGMLIDHPRCENISLYVRSFHPKNKMPIGIITDCGGRYEKFLTHGVDDQVMMHEADALFLALKYSEREIDGLLSDQAIMEDTAEIMKKEGEQIQKHSDQRIDGFVKRHGDIMKARRGWLYRLRNLKWVFIFLIVIAVLFFLYCMLTGWRPF